MAGVGGTVGRKWRQLYLETTTIKKGRNKRKKHKKTLHITRPMPTDLFCKYFPMHHGLPFNFYVRHRSFVFFK